MFFLSRDIEQQACTKLFLAEKITRSTIHGKFFQNIKNGDNKISKTPVGGVVQTIEQQKYTNYCWLLVCIWTDL